MKGLDERELRAMEMIAAGFQPVTLTPMFDRLIKRGALVPVDINCGADGCPGHKGVEITTTGAWLMAVVRRPPW